MLKDNTKILHLKEETIVTIISYLYLAAEVCREKSWEERAEEAEAIIDELNNVLEGK